MTGTTVLGGASAAPSTPGPAAAGGGDVAPVDRFTRAFGPAWPLKLLLLGFPLWWALGFASFSFLIAAVAMAVQLYRRRGIRVPRGFGVWVLFLVWMLLGVFVLWAHAPGTADGGGAERLVGFAYRACWYLAVTVAMLYTMNLPHRQVPSLAVVRWLGYLFVVCVVGGVAGLLVPRFEFTSLAELMIPGAEGAFLQTKLHPSLTTYSDFLGYELARPKAPFSYANTWGNTIGLLLPFFVYSVVRSRSAWRRAAGALVLLVALVPIGFSLNRGLWLGLAVLLAYTLVVLARSRRFALIWAAVAAVAVAAVVVAASPVGQTIALRLDTPHSNDRRGTVAEVVVGTTYEGSPLLGFGTNRQVVGSFSSLAGGGSPDCRQCAAPPLGTQGFLWRLVFTTGFVGTALFCLFMLVQLLVHVRRKDPVAVLGCMTLALSALFFVVYDSLESPLFVLMLAIGLMNRAEHAGFVPTADTDHLPVTPSGNLSREKR